MNRLFYICALLLLAQLATAQVDTKKVLICSYEFNSQKELKDWQIEGEGKASILNGQLILEPTYFQELKKLMEEGKISRKNEVSEYQPYVLSAMTKKYGKDISRYYAKTDDGKSQFTGGNFNIWNTKFPTGANFSIEFDFKCLYPAPLHMVMFSAMGTNGKSIFDAGFPIRYGLASEIMTGDLSNYRLSFFEPYRKTANLRKAPGRKLLFEGEDVVSNDPNKTYHFEIRKLEGTIIYIVDGKTIFSYTDEIPLGGGHWGFRLMPCAMGAYDNIKIYQL